MIWKDCLMRLLKPLLRAAALLLLLSGCADPQPDADPDRVIRESPDSRPAADRRGPNGPSYRFVLGEGTSAVLVETANPERVVGRYDEVTGHFLYGKGVFRGRDHRIAIDRRSLRPEEGIELAALAEGEDPRLVAHFQSIQRTDRDRYLARGTLRTGTSERAFLLPLDFAVEDRVLKLTGTLELGVEEALGRTEDANPAPQRLKLQLTLHARPAQQADNSSKPVPSASSRPAPGLP